MNKKNVLLHVKRDFTRLSFISAIIFAILTYVLWFVVPEWHIIPEVVAFYLLGVWCAEVKVGKLRDWLIPLIIIAVAFPIINQNLPGFIITGYFVFAWLIGYLTEKKSQKKKEEERNG